ncbi:LysR substrate-binding domain-containing protein [Parathalassolituus penaei]|uniref:LysR substrate-binding domain-containing protein n=1 Tax=Parathalassolituus penaei TaxID=2997323 RepID=A0A9X3EB37_9GAMM|nr:LysR substrate-binding domain-containing protein [Parathalassolituus penaei]MCY0964278.1 LysR substrate-binding domain-containing protein [Parathalassolituus penaei]
MANWEGVQEFVAVAETGSFTRAAQRLGISVAQISRQVSALESRLSTELLHRTTRKVSVTEAGRLYYQHCRPLLEGLDEAERALTRLQGQASGLIRLTAPITYGEQQVAPLLNGFLLQHPAVRFDLQLTNQKLDLIDGGLDLAIRLGRLEDSSMMARRLGSRRLYVCASPSYLSQYGEPRTLAELQDHNCLPGTLDSWRFRESGQERSLRVNGSLRVNSGFALVDAAIKGIGLVQLPDYYVSDHMARGELVPILEEFQPDDEGIWALYPRSRHLLPKIRLLVDYLYDALNNGPANQVTASAAARIVTRGLDDWRELGEAEPL